MHPPSTHKVYFYDLVVADGRSRRFGEQLEPRDIFSAPELDQ